MNASYFRERAREILQGKWKNAVLVAFVACIFGALLTGSNFSLDFEVKEEWMEHIPDLILSYLAIAGTVGGTLNVLQFVMGGVVQLGYCKYLLKLHDGQEGDTKDLFSEMDRFGDGFLLNLLRGLFVFLWCLLFIIPGFIAAYSYAMAPFIMQENPGMKAKEAISASKEMMDGHKWDLFVLDLSFIGWHLLCSLTLGIGYLWLNPYMNTSHAAFYRQLNPRVTPQVIPELAEEQAVSVEE